MADGEYVAVLDRFEAGERARLAVLLLECDGRQVDELADPADDLPAEVGRDAILDVTVLDGDLVAAEYRPGRTADRTAKAQRRLDRLASRPGDDAPGRGDDSTAKSFLAAERTRDAMVQAYLMISAAAGTAEGLVETLRALDTVSEAHVVAGQWDVVTEMEAETVADVLHSVTADIRSLDGVGTTRCYVCLD